MAETIKASELIGRTFLSVKFQIPVTCMPEDIAELVHRADGARIDDYISEMFEPIPLTEEWLVKFGFSDKDYKGGYIGIDVGNHSFTLSKPLRMGEWSKYYAFEYKSGGWNKYNEFKFVHEFQNFFFTLTGEELEIKPKENE